jgi:hypothetical protein
LDQARYADSNGYSIDAPRQIWKYRDWVIEALNADIPFDQFTVDQLAGDLLPGATQSQIVATGFHRNTQINQEGGIDKEQFRIDSVFDRVATTGTVWLGMTIGCAQCHDHKFDPFEQREYYRLFAFFNSQDEPTIKVIDPGFDLSEYEKEFKELEGKIAAYMRDHADELTDWEASLTPQSRKSLSAAVQKVLSLPREKWGFADRRALWASGVGGVGPFRVINDRYEELNTVLKGGVTTLVMKEQAAPRKTHLLIKGDFTRPDEEVGPGTPAVLHPFTPPSGRRPNRLDLAHWIVDPANPLTARVVVNRVWQQYFGRGIVETENDFGMQGTSPSHPELLDWLARGFVDSGWDIKQLHRQILTSATWRQAGRIQGDPKGTETDPENRWLWHYPRQRLEAEMIRDGVLAVSGRLDRSMGGSLVAWKNDEYTPEDTVSETSRRRTLYLPVVRDRVYDLLTLFDFANPSVGVSRRTPTVVSHQALFWINSPWVKDQAGALASDVRSGEQRSVQQRVSLAYERVLGRLPTDAEQGRAVAFLSKPGTTATAPDSADRWLAWCQVLLASSEFQYRD